MGVFLGALVRILSVAGGAYLGSHLYHHGRVMRVSVVRTRKSVKGRKVVAKHKAKTQAKSRRRPTNAARPARRTNAARPARRTAAR